MIEAIDPGASWPATNVASTASVGTSSSSRRRALP